MHQILFCKWLWIGKETVVVSGVIVWRNLTLKLLRFVNIVFFLTIPRTKCDWLNSIHRLGFYWRYVVFFSMHDRRWIFKCKIRRKCDCEWIGLPPSCTDRIDGIVSRRVSLDMADRDADKFTELTLVYFWMWSFGRCVRLPVPSGQKKDMVLPILNIGSIWGWGVS